MNNQSLPKQWNHRAGNWVRPYSQVSAAWWRLQPTVHFVRQRDESTRSHYHQYEIQSVSDRFGLISLTKLFYCDQKFPIRNILLCKDGSIAHFHRLSFLRI